MLVNQPESFDEAIAACAVIAADHATSEKETHKGLDQYLHQAVPALSNLLQRVEIVDALWSFVQNLAELIRHKQNSIWSFVIRNSYRPAMLREQFDIILGNPPWVAYRFVSDIDYQQEIKLRAVQQYKIAPKHQRLFTQMELATVFLGRVHAI
jgi:hypothetical protein